MPARAKPRVDITILDPFRGQISRPWLRKVALHAMEGALTGEDWQLSLAIADDDTLKRLNRDYRGLDEVTDVLAFSPFHQGYWEGEGDPLVQAEDAVAFVTPPGDSNFLGEVIISYPQAAQQASLEPSGLEKELALLIVHGVLHLMGHDHVEPQEEASMQDKEQAILKSLSLRPFPIRRGKGEVPKVGAT